MSKRTPLPLAPQESPPPPPPPPAADAPARSGVVLWEGPSPWTGRPVGVIATGVWGKGTENPKTGPMIQVWTLAADENPDTARAAARDDSVCGACELRAGGGCYVPLWAAPTQVWRSWRSSQYSAWSQRAERALRGRMVRWGAYGEPVALPLPLLASISRRSGGWTGYTHAWREERFAGYRPYLMASADNADDAQAAHALGWRTYRLRRPGEPMLAHEFTCPASAEAGRRLTCAECLACDGLRGRADAAPSRASVSIYPHGRASGRIR